MKKLLIIFILLYPTTFYNSIELKIEVFKVEK